MPENKVDISNKINALSQTHNDFGGDGVKKCKEPHECVDYANACYKVHLSKRTKGKPDSIEDIFYVYDANPSRRLSDTAAADALLSSDLKLMLKVPVGYEFGKDEEAKVMDKLYEDLKNKIAEATKAHMNEVGYIPQFLERTISGFEIGNYQVNYDSYDKELKVTHDYSSDSKHLKQIINIMAKEIRHAIPFFEELRERVAE